MASTTDVSLEALTRVITMVELTSLASLSGQPLPDSVSMDVFQSFRLSLSAQRPELCMSWGEVCQRPAPQNAFSTVIHKPGRTSEPLAWFKKVIMGDPIF